MSQRIEFARYADGPRLADAACSEIVKRANQAIETRGAFHVALSGGSTPRATYQRLARAGWTTSFAHWHIWFGDERCVPPEHQDSNYRMVREALLDHAEVPAAQVHRMRGEATDVREAADAYEREFAWAFGSREPRFDLALLGLGADGHTASLFPGTDALAERERSVVANWVEKLASHRLTLTLPALNAARGVLFLVSGRDKAEAVRATFSRERKTPAALIAPRDGRVTWFADRAAASRLDPSSDTDFS